jgi:hypothetical protein
MNPTPRGRDHLWIHEPSPSLPHSDQLGFAGLSWSFALGESSIPVIHRPTPTSTKQLFHEKRRKNAVDQDSEREEVLEKR